jgi:AbrB family looped-hinge helix DNA binding protein
MRVTIDAEGRILVPERMCDELGLVPGTELELRLVDRRIVLAVAATPMRLEEHEHGVVAVTDRVMPTLSSAQVRETLERVRR